MSSELSPATAARLRLLRFRVTALIALLATVAVVVLAVVVVRIDRQLRDEQIDAELLRRGDEATRQVSFDEGELVADAPADGLDGVVLAVNPSFSVEEFQLRQDEFGFPDPSDADLERNSREILFDAELETQEFLIASALESAGDEAYVDAVDIAALLEDGETTVGPVVVGDGDDVELLPPLELFLDDVVEGLLDDPPDELFDEAYRRYVIEQADEAGVELEFETAIYRTPDAGLSDDQVLDLAELIVEEERSEIRDSLPVPGDGGDSLDFVVRATELRDGPQVRGAVIAVLDPADFDDAHVSLRNRVIALSVAVVAGSVVAAWFVGGTSIRPTAAALAQQERFLADAAHELRTPIAAIRSTAESATDQTAAAKLDRVVELATDASTLTDDLLTLARMDADRMELQRQPVRLDLLVETVVAEVPGAADAFDLRLREVVVDADAGLVGRAVGNLIRNAMAHGEAHPKGPATISVRAERGVAVVRVSDRGPGVDEELLADLFERFRARTGSGGHGLGLPLAQWIAREHGGDLVVSPSRGDGAEFVLTLPHLEHDGMT